jgi:pimeloyl-ACP methyl ester carboxylesterase/DNA-binding CsgD family transcriptional regulator
VPRDVTVSAPTPGQKIKFLVSPDGVKLAYALAGQGPPLVKVANWLSHLEYDWHSPVWRHWFDFLTRRNQVLRYDARGCGLSDWSVQDLEFPALVMDLEAVVNAAGAERFALLGISQGGAIAIDYAVRHPERVSHLILYGAYAQGWERRNEPEDLREGQALTEMIRIGWGQDNPAFRQLFASLFIPEATEEQSHWFAELMHRTTEPEVAARLMESLSRIDVSDRLARVEAPTLVLHARNDARVPFDQGRLLAASIPGARFVALEGRNHILLKSEPAWARFCDAVAEFLGHEADRPEPLVASVFHELTTREADILRLVAAGASNLQIAGKLFISEKTVRNHLTSIFSKLGVTSRAQAIVMARDNGLFTTR